MEQKGNLMGIVDREDFVKDTHKMKKGDVKIKWLLQRHGVKPSDVV